MKRFLLVISAVFSIIPLSAQSADAILSKIGTKASQNISKSFVEVRKPTSGKETKLDGTLVFKTEGYLSMDYSNGELFVIDGNKMTVKRAGKTQVFDTSKNLMMQGLSHMLIYSFQGKVKELAEEQGTELAAFQDGDQYVVTLTAVKKSARGYSKAIFRYDARSCAIKSMVLTEFSGKVTTYTL